MARNKQVKRDLLPSLNQLHQSERHNLVRIKERYNSQTSYKFLTSREVSGILF